MVRSRREWVPPTLRDELAASYEREAKFIIDLAEARPGTERPVAAAKAMAVAEALRAGEPVVVGGDRLRKLTPKGSVSTLVAYLVRPDGSLTEVDDQRSESVVEQMYDRGSE